MDNQTPEINPNGSAPTGNNAPGKGLSIAALVCGIVAFFLNPLYLVGIAAIVCGIVGMNKKGNPSRTMAIVGLSLGAGATVWQIGNDILLTVFTAGLGAFSCCF